ncbi:PKD domain-containing protein, partial [Flavobacteriales bacterium]|nr:PKD domain-containing protein [Flavobacteriales bacterium]
IATGGTWATSGTGTFSPDNSTLGATYIPSDADTTAGTVTLTLTTTGNGLCQTYSDQMIVTLSPAPIANANVDQTVCGDIASVPLNGSVITATGGSWTTSGNGTFSPNNNTLNASYVPTTADTLAGSVTLTLTTTGNGTCSAYSDDMLITFTTAPTVNAGTDITTCQDIASIALNGYVTIATGGTWTTSGSGTFNPNATTLTASYIPSAADTATGGATLTLTTTGNGLCNAYSDNVVITLTNIPTVDAGIDQTICADITGISLNGGVAIASGGIWTTNGTGIFTPSGSDLNATYVQSLGDTMVGNVILTLTTTGNGLCNAYNDLMNITITPAPVAFAGNDTSVCSTNATVPLDGIVYTGTGGVWSTNGSGTFTPNDTDLNAIYETSLGDQTNGSVEIYLTTTGNGLCNAVTDTLSLTITPTNITVLAGIDTLVCGDDSLVLNGVIATALGGIWTTLGDGTFSDSTDLNGSYYFGPNDTVSNTVELILTTTGNGGCFGKVDSFQVDIQDPLQLSVLSADTVCRNGGEFNISSTASTGQGYWISNGDGSFLPDSSLLIAQYLPGTLDTASNSVTLTFITENNGVCAAINDSLVIELIDAPTVNFGFADVCLNETAFFTDSSFAIGGLTNWDWDFNDTTLSSMQDTSVIFTSFGTQTATLVVTSGYGCIDSLTLDIIVSPLPTAILTSNADCYEDSVEMFDASTVPAGSIIGWEWEVENGFTGTTQDISVIFDSAGIYATTLIITTDMGCTDTITDSLQVQPNPIASFVSDSVCLNEFSTMVDVSNVEFGTIVTWDWIVDGVSIDTLSNTSFVFSSDSLQPITLVVTSSYGCIDTITQNVLIYPLPNNIYSYEGFCEEDDVLFTDESTINTGQIVAWNWNYGNGDSSNVQNPSYGFGEWGDYNITLITTSDYGCLDTLVQNISISPNPSAEFSMNDGTNEIVITQTLDDVFFVDESVDASQWNWDFGDNFGSSLEQNPIYSFNPYGQYNVILTITNDFGCTDTVSHVITVKQPPVLPLAFSPNGDGLNDVFYVLGGTFTDFRFEIYNNWGKMIFETNDALVGWDGKHMDIEQPLGVYVWIYHVVTEDGEEYTGHGDVTIIR